MTVDDLYGLPAEAYYKLDLSLLTPQDLTELAYYIWCWHEDNEELLKWRLDVLLPKCKPSIEEVEDLDGE